MPEPYLERLRRLCREAKAEIAKLPEWLRCNLPERHNPKP